MKTKNKIIALALSLSMLSAFAPVASAEEAPTSGTFNEIFSWDFSGDTLTFSVDENAEVGNDLLLTDNTLISEYEKRPWLNYLSQVKHVIFDDAITRISSTIIYDFRAACINETASIETFTFGEHIDIEAVDTLFVEATCCAPKYSYCDYWSFQEGIKFQPTSIAQEPYLKLKDVDNEWEYNENDNIIKMYGSISYTTCDNSSNWYGRYSAVLLGENAVFATVSDGIKPINAFHSYLLNGAFHTQSRYYNPITLCYPSIGMDNIEYLRSKEKTVVILGESNSELKGDATLDGNIDISDATTVLDYYSNKTAGLEASFKNDEELNKFAYYLADTDTESTQGADSDAGNISISDSTNILKYYAQSIAELEPDWQEIIAEQ